MGEIAKSMNEVYQPCLNCGHNGISHMEDIFDNPQGRLRKAYSTCKDCKKEGKKKICHDFKPKK